jgi:hypothetical protein
MDLTHIARMRLFSQHLGGEKIKSVKEIAAWMGAMQAQDAAMVKWAVGIRLPGSTEKTVEAAIDRGELLRTHLLRPTWHLVSQDDIVWLLELTAPAIKSAMKARHRELGLTESVISKSNSVIDKALQGGEHLLREELIALLNQANIATHDNRASHLLSCAELDGVICSGRIKAGKPTYALLEERAVKTEPLTKEMALAKLAQRYFTSHGPATLKDFAWWAGLSLGDAARGLEMIQVEISSDTIDGRQYWFPDDITLPKNDSEQVYLLPAFDELIISYQDRSAVLPGGIDKKAISENGMFRPVIVVNGQVIGTWKRSIKKDRVSVEIELFKQPGKSTFDTIEKSAAQYGFFLEKEPEVIWK